MEAVDVFLRVVDAVGVVDVLWRVLLLIVVDVLRMLVVDAVVYVLDVVVVVRRVLVDTVVVALRVAVMSGVFTQHWQRLLGSTHVTTAE